MKQTAATARADDSQLTRREREHYEALYRRDPNHAFIASGHEMIHRWISEGLSHGASIIDIGCGSGHHYRKLADGGFQVFGAELALTALRTLGPECGRTGTPRRLVCGDARRLPFPDRAFDASALFLVLHHFLRYDEVVVEAARVTRRYLITLEPNLYNPQSWLLLNVLNPLGLARFLTPNQRAVSPRFLERLLANEGFHLVRREYLTLASTDVRRGLRRAVHAAQGFLPRSMRHNKFFQIYERDTEGE